MIFSEDQITKVWGAVLSVFDRRTAPTDPTDPDPLGEMIEALGTALNNTELGSAERELLVALYWLGPENCGPPPSEIFTEIASLTERLQERDAELRLGMICELVVAFGAGAWSITDSQADGWFARWPRAVLWITAAVYGWLKAASKWLHLDVTLPGYRLDDWPNQADAAVIAQEAITGQCRCWTWRDPDAEDLTRQAKERQKRCIRDHQLAAWNPQTISLRNYIAQAIKGSKAAAGSGKRAKSGAKGFMSGAFVQGMYFPQLVFEKDFWFGNVLGHVCSHNNEHWYEDPSCFYCSRENGDRITVFDEARDRKSIIERLLVRGVYISDMHWRCQACEQDNYYREALSTCPVCNQGRKRGSKRTTVWRKNTESDFGGPTELDRSQFGETLGDAIAQLTPEQQSLVAMLAEGVADAEIAKELGVSGSEYDDLRNSAYSAIRAAMAAGDDERAAY